MGEVGDKQTNFNFPLLVILVLGKLEKCQIRKPSTLFLTSKTFDLYVTIDIWRYWHQFSSGQVKVGKDNPLEMVGKRGITYSNGNKESADKKADHGGSQEKVTEVFVGDNHDDDDNDADADDAGDADNNADKGDDADDALSAARRMSRRCSPVTTTAGFH